jgi:hypothetical protein
MEDVTLGTAMQMYDEDLLWDMWILHGTHAERVTHADLETGDYDGARLNGTWYDAAQRVRIERKTYDMNGVPCGVGDVRMRPPRGGRG